MPSKRTARASSVQADTASLDVDDVEIARLLEVEAAAQRVVRLWSAQIGAMMRLSEALAKPNRSHEPEHNGNPLEV